MEVIILFALFGIYMVVSVLFCDYLVAQDDDDFFNASFLPMVGRLFAWPVTWPIYLWRKHHVKDAN